MKRLKATNGRPGSEKRRQVLAVTIGLPVLIRQGHSWGAQSIRLQRVSPPITLPNHSVWGPQGEIAQIPQYERGIHLINLWATWCAPCVKELPSLKRFSDRYQKLGYQVTLLSQDKGGPAIARSFLARLGLEKMTSLSDPKGRFYNDLHCRGLPTTLVVGPDKKVYAKIEGEVDWDAKEIPDLLSSVLGRVP